MINKGFSTILGEKPAVSKILIATESQLRFIVPEDDCRHR